MLVCFTNSLASTFQIANQSGYVDIHFDRIRDSAERRLNQVQHVAAAHLPPTTTVNGEEVETIVDQSSNNVVETVSERRASHSSCTNEPFVSSRSNDSL